MTIDSSKFNAIPLKATVVVAVSGGVDSMVLLHALQNGRPDLKISAVHVNHQLRSDALSDQKMVEAFCKTLNIPLHSKTITAPKEGNLEEWGRHERYQFLEEVREKEDAQFILTAHHLNDDLESFFLHLTRGTRLKGLMGMRETRNAIHRPFLKTLKSELIKYAHQNKIPYHEDSTNQDTQFKRNALRLNVLPPLLEEFPNFPDHWLKLKEYLGGLQAWISTCAEQFLAENLTQNTLNKKAYSALPYPLRAQVLEQWYRTSTGERVHHEEQIQRWDHAILFFENGKKTEWSQNPKPSFLIIEKTHVKIG